MLKNLKMLLSLRAWLKSRTLNIAGIMAAIATMDVTTGSGIIQKVIDLLVNSFGLMPATAVAILVALKSIADAVLRVKTDKSVADK